MECKLYLKQGYLELTDIKSVSCIAGIYAKKGFIHYFVFSKTETDNIS